MASRRSPCLYLDGILGNETVLPVVGHSVDTTGFTETFFALFSALGLRFSPCISDVGIQILYRLDGMDDAGFAGSLLRGKKIDEGAILEHRDDILRAAGSLKLGWVTASLLVSTCRPNLTRARSPSRSRSTGGCARRSSCSGTWRTRT